MSKVEPITREEAEATARVYAAAGDSPQMALLWQRILATIDAQRWVPVTERVPEDGEQVLVRGWGERRKHYVFSLAERRRSSPNTLEWFDDDAEPLWFEAVDWMPLPTAPEVK